MDIPHSRYKISILALGERMLLQIEDGPFIQTFKYRVPEEFKDAEEVKRLVDEHFLEKIGLNFREMGELRKKAFHKEEDKEDFNFPEII